MIRASRAAGSRASTICPLPPQIASITGRLDAGPTTIPGCRRSGCDAWLPLVSGNPRLDHSGTKTIAASRSARLIWKALLALFVTCALASLIAWGVLLTAICSSTRKGMPEAPYVIPYGCHGMTVYMSPLQDALRHWLIPIGGIFVVLSVIAAVMVVLASANVRLDVRVQTTDASRGSAPPEDGRG